LPLLGNSHCKGGNERTAVKPIQAQFLIAFEIVFGVFSKDMFSWKYIILMFFLIILIIKKSIQSKKLNLLDKISRYNYIIF